MGAPRADDHGLAVPARALGRDDRAGARRLRGGRQRDRRVRAGDDDRQPGRRCRRRRARHARPRSTSSSSRSTTRGCATAARSTSTSDDGGRTVAVHFALQRLGREVRPLGPRRPDRPADRRAIWATASSRSALVLEGGSILSDGAGTLLTTEQCLLHPSPQPVALARADRARTDAAARRRALRVARPGSGRGSRHRRPRRPDRRLHAARTRAALQTVARDNPNYENCQENRRRLDAAGIAVIELPLLPYAEVAGETIAASYLNLYICNGAVIVPVAGATATSRRSR